MLFRGMAGELARFGPLWAAYFRVYTLDVLDRRVQPPFAPGNSLGRDWRLFRMASRTIVANPFPQKAQCLVCTNPSKTRGLCSKHYMQLRAKAYDVTKVNWYEKVKNVPSALALLGGGPTTTVPLPTPVQGPAPVPSAAPSHDAWVAAYATCLLKGESMDAFLNTLVTSWYERTFPALAHGQPESITVHAAMPSSTSATH